MIRKPLVFGVKLSVIEVFWFLKCYLLFISTMNTKNTLNSNYFFVLNRIHHTCKESKVVFELSRPHQAKDVDI